MPRFWRLFGGPLDGRMGFGGEVGGWNGVGSDLEER